MAWQRREILINYNCDVKTRGEGNGVPSSISHAYFREEADIPRCIGGWGVSPTGKAQWLLRA